MELLLYLLVIMTITLLVMAIHSLFFNRRVNVKTRLEDVKDLYKGPEEDDDLNKPFNERVIKPAYQKAIGFIGRATPNQINKSMEKTIAHAGAPDNMTVNRFLAIQLMLGIIFPGVLYLLANMMGNKLNVFLLILIGVIGFILPLYSLRGKARKRQDQIRKALPSVLDLLFVSVEAGLGFDMALKRTIEKMGGPLSDEFRRALDEINKGRRRDEALRGIVHRTGVDDLASFISAVIQSEQLGSNIANMLRIQSTSMRQKRRQRAEELATKVPIRMLFPLVFFMFPALFIVILGPAIMRIIEIFADMF